MQHGTVVIGLDVGREILEPGRLRQVRVGGIALLRAETERAAGDEVRAPRSRFAAIGSLPRHRCTAAVTTLVGEVATGVERRRILKTIPRNVRHFEQAQFLALIHVGGTRQAQFHQRGCAGATGAELTILAVGLSVTQQPIMRQLVVRSVLHLRQTETRRTARHIVVVHNPRRGGTVRFLGGAQAVSNGRTELVGEPVGFGELEIEHLAELVGGRVQMLRFGLHPRLADGETRRIVLVEHLTPFAVDVVHFRTVPQRAERAVRRQHMLHRGRIHVGQRHGIEVLGQAVRHVDAEAVGAVVGPESQRFLEFLVHVRILPIQIRLLLGEHVQVPLSVIDLLPRRAAEQRLPVVRRQLAVLAAAFAEDVAVACGRTSAGGKRLDEHLVLVGRVVRHDVDDHLDAGFMRGGGHRVEIGHGAEARVHVAVVDHVVAAVGQVGRVERAQPDRVDAEILQVIHFLGDAGDVSQPVAVHVFEAARVDLVDDGLLPPIVTHVIRGHYAPFVCACNRCTADNDSIAGRPLRGRAGNRVSVCADRPAVRSFVPSFALRKPADRVADRTTDRATQTGQPHRRSYSRTRRTNRPTTRSTARRKPANRKMACVE